MRVLIPGGAGFIGSHLTDLLLHHRYGVRILVAAWLDDQVAEDRVDHATAELESRGLVA